MSYFGLKPRGFYMEYMMNATVRKLTVSTGLSRDKSLNEVIIYVSTSRLNQKKALFL